MKPKDLFKERKGVEEVKLEKSSPMKADQVKPKVQAQGKKAKPLKKVNISSSSFNVVDSLWHCRLEIIVRMMRWHMLAWLDGHELSRFWCVAKTLYNIVFS